VRTEKADYSEISEVYDQARTSCSPHLQWWFQRIAELAQLAPGRRLIDLGCGTGRWTIPLAERTGCEAVGLDNSPEMLEKARQKDTANRVTWLVGDVEHLEPHLQSFDCAFLCLMLHHLDDHVATFRGIREILRPGGLLLVRQGTLEQIMNDRTHRFFPEALTIDRKRTPLRAEVEHWLREAGFDNITSEEVTQTTYQTNERLLTEIGLRVCSVLRLLPEEAFERGLKRLEQHLAAHPDEPSLKQDLFTLFSARRPR
jgi:ubiquinone/menaquinone biosynthesis C-methylase UbiE